MSYIFSSNGNNYTFKKLDNMLINMPEKDGHHVLIRETVDGVPQYSWGSAACIVKANEAFVFEYTSILVGECGLYRESERSICLRVHTRNYRIIQWRVGW